MSGKFDGVPIEHDTIILLQQEAKLGQYDILYQKWFWDGITAESIIFANEDIIDLNDREIEMQVRTSPLLKPDSSITTKRSESGFTFVNFNFDLESGLVFGNFNFESAINRPSRSLLVKWWSRITRFVRPKPSASVTMSPRGDSPSSPNAIMCSDRNPAPADVPAMYLTNALHLTAIPLSIVAGGAWSLAAKRSQMKYTVMVDDNFRSMGETDRGEFGKFDSLNDARNAAMEIVDGFLIANKDKVNDENELMALYSQFGESPFILDDDPNNRFSAWTYARQKCEELFEKGKPPHY